MFLCAAIRVASGSAGVAASMRLPPTSCPFALGSPSLCSKWQHRAVVDVVQPRVEFMPVHRPEVDVVVGTPAVTASHEMKS
jgi:hypothetical protein